MILVFITSEMNCDLLPIELRGVKQPTCTYSCCDSRDIATGSQTSRCCIGQMFLIVLRTIRDDVA